MWQTSLKLYGRKLRRPGPRGRKSSFLAKEPLSLGELLLLLLPQCHEACPGTPLGSRLPWHRMAWMIMDAGSRAPRLSMASSMASSRESSGDTCPNNKKLQAGKTMGCTPTAVRKREQRSRHLLQIDRLGWVRLLHKVLIAEPGNTQTQTRRHTDTQTRRHTDTQAHGHADMQAHRHTDKTRHADKTDRQTVWTFGVGRKPSAFGRSG